MPNEQAENQSQDRSGDTNQQTLRLFSTPTDDEPAERTARIAAYEDSSVGVCIFLTVEQLKRVGVDPEDIECVAYSIDDQAERILVSGKGSSDSTPTND